MASTVEAVGPCRKKLRVEVATEQVAGTRQEVLKEIRKAARIPGFRPGFAPEAMVASRYAREIEDELRRRVIPEHYRMALREQQLKVVGYPQIEEVQYQPGQPFRFVAEVDTAPEFALGEYKGIPVKKRGVVVNEEDVARMLETLRDQQADFVTVEGRPLAMGDFAVIHYRGEVEGRPITELAPAAGTLGENKDFWIRCEPDAFLKGFCEQLIGARPGEQRHVRVDLPAELAPPALAGKTATYVVDLQAIKEKKLPELNDEFARKVGAESLAQLQEDLRKGMMAEREAEVASELRQQVMTHLLGRISFDLPESLVAQETRSIVYDVVRENTMRGASKEQLEEKKDEIYGFAQKSARDRLRSSFILDAIAEKENITVTAEEMERRIAVMAQRYRTTPAKLKAQLAEKDALGEVEEQVRVSKTLDFLVANATVETVKA